MKPVHLPHTLDALWSILKHEPDTAIYAGGPDVLVWRRKGLLAPPSFTCLERIEALKGVEEKRDRIGIGAVTPYCRLLTDASIRSHFPVLIQAMKVLGSPHIRNMGTIGGNIVTASPAGDCLPPLYVLDAELEVSSPWGVRRIGIDRFIKGPGITDLAPGEILSRIWLKKTPGYTLHHYEKVGRRNALACAVVSLAAVMKMNAAGRIENVRLAWGSAGPTVVRSPEAEDALKGGPLSVSVLTESARKARVAVQPIDDVRGSAEYRRRVAGNLLLRLVRFAHSGSCGAETAGGGKRLP